MTETMELLPIFVTLAVIGMVNAFPHEPKPISDYDLFYDYYDDETSANAGK